MDVPFFFHEAYKAAFVSHMASRLDAMIHDQCKVLFRRNDLQTPIKAVSVVVFLHKHPGATLFEMAKAFGQPHQLVAARLKLLETKKLVRRLSDTVDARRIRLYLSDAGQKDAERVLETCGHLATCFNEVFETAGVDLVSAMFDVMQELDSESLEARLRRIVQQDI
jgi:DNA-binding MarR family transcriptional regulator